MDGLLGELDEVGKGIVVEGEGEGGLGLGGGGGVLGEGGRDREERAEGDLRGAGGCSVDEQRGSCGWTETEACSMLTFEITSPTVAKSLHRPSPVRAKKSSISRTPMLYPLQPAQNVSVKLEQRPESGRGRTSCLVGC